METRKYAVDVHICISLVAETPYGPDHAAELIAAPDFDLGKEIEQKVADGCYEVRAIETEGEVP
jgi:hypothetical protein